MKILCVAIVLLIAALNVNAVLVDCQPQQIHIALGRECVWNVAVTVIAMLNFLPFFFCLTPATGNDGEMVVTWSTMDATTESIIEYGIDDYTMLSYGNATKFVDGGAGKHTQYIHRVTLAGLEPETRYIYHCGSSCGWSSEFWFHTLPLGSNWSPSIAIFGDMGNENAQSLTYLQEEAQRKMYDAIIHVGDFAYDMDSYNALTGDQFMRQIEPLAAFVPYMVCAGNHEER